MFPEWIKEVEKKRIKLVEEKKVMKELRKLVHHNYKTLPLEKPLRINVYPRIVISKLNKSCNGYAYRESYMMSLFIDGNKGWKQALRSTFAHEYMHLLYRYPYDNVRTFTEICIREGLSIHFAEYRNGKQPGSYEYLSYKRIAKIIKENKYWINRVLSTKKTSELLKNPISPPHSVGYVMVGLFLQSLRTISWKTITIIPPREIMNIAQLVLESRIIKASKLDKKA